jgi:hypothetical protein
MKKIYPKTPDEKIKMCSGCGEPYIDAEGDLVVYNAKRKRFVVIETRAAREQAERGHQDRQNEGILRTEWKHGEPELTEAERTAMANKLPTHQCERKAGEDRFFKPITKPLENPTTEKEMIDAIARAELIDEIPKYKQGCCLDRKKVGQRKGAISTWLNAAPHKELFRKIYREEANREGKQKDRRYSPLIRAISRFAREHTVHIEEKTARRYLKKDDSYPRRFRL